MSRTTAYTLLLTVEDHGGLPPDELADVVSTVVDWSTACEAIEAGIDGALERRGLAPTVSVGLSLVHDGAPR